jgi:hypothetical protein
VAGRVYFIEAVGTGTVKIGYTEGDPEDRLKQLQTGCPNQLRVAAWMAGRQEDEAELHKLFARHRVNGEWFNLSPELTTAIFLVRWVLPEIMDFEHQDIASGYQVHVLNEQVAALAAHVKAIAADTEAMRRLLRVGATASQDGVMTYEMLAEAFIRSAGDGEEVMPQAIGEAFEDFKKAYGERNDPRLALYLAATKGLVDIRTSGEVGSLGFRFVARGGR